MVLSASMINKETKKETNRQTGQQTHRWPDLTPCIVQGRRTDEMNLASVTRLFLVSMPAMALQWPQP